MIRIAELPDNVLFEEDRLGRYIFDDTDAAIERIRRGGENEVLKKTKLAEYANASAFRNGQYPQVGECVSLFGAVLSI